MICKISYPRVVMLGYYSAVTGVVNKRIKYESPPIHHLIADATVTYVRCKLALHTTMTSRDRPMYLSGICMDAKLYNV